MVGVAIGFDSYKLLVFINICLFCIIEKFVQYDFLAKDENRQIKK